MTKKSRFLTSRKSIPNRLRNDRGSLLSIWGYSLSVPGSIPEISFSHQNDGLGSNPGQIPTVPVHSWKPDKAHDYLQLNSNQHIGQGFGFHKDSHAEMMDKGSRMGSGPRWDRGVSDSARRDPPRQIQKEMLHTVLQKNVWDSQGMSGILFLGHYNDSDGFWDEHTARMMKMEI